MFHGAEIFPFCLAGCLNRSQRSSIPNLRKVAGVFFMLRMDEKFAAQLILFLKRQVPEFVLESAIVKF
jgi:hypothetical protein